MAQGEKGAGKTRHSLRHWLSGSIRRRLILLVMAVCLLLIGLVWVLVVNLLEPMYMRKLRMDLDRSVNGIIAIADEIEQEGLAVTELGLTFIDNRLVFSEIPTEEFKNRLNEALINGVLVAKDRSIDLGSSEAQYLALIDSDPNSILHPFTSPLSATSNDGQTMEDREKNGQLMVALRLETLEKGDIYQVLTSSGHMVVGKTSASGAITVIAAGNIERISQAIDVFNGIMLPVAAILLIVSVAAAWLFSQWFTRPLRNLSAASQELARGNYDVQVNEQGHDEIAILAQDFNAMAREVKRSTVLQQDLIANVSHDLRTPLTLIKGYAETVRDLTGDDPQRRTEQLDVIVDEADRLSTLVGRVMELSRVSTGHEKPEPVLFDLSQLCDEVGYRYNDFCAQGGCHFEFSTDGPSEVYADPALIERALHNLLGNGLKHIGPDGYLGFRVLHTPHGTARVEVIDHGEGISPEDLPYIFDKYYRSRSDTGKIGTGLGLSITKAIFVVQRLNYGVQSQLGEGATFWFEVPLAERPAPRDGKAKPAEGAPQKQ